MAKTATRSALLGCALLLLLLFLLPGAAGAGTYQVRSCAAEAGGSNNVWSLQASQGMLAYVNGCPASTWSYYGVPVWNTTGTGTGITIRNVVTSAGGTLPRGAFALMSSAAPAGTNFTAMDLQYSAAGTNGWWTTIQAGNPAAGINIRSIAGCLGGVAPQVGCGEALVGKFFHFDLATNITNLVIRTDCANASTCPADGSGTTPMTASQARFNLYDSILTVNDYTGPGFGTVAGQLTETGWQSGTRGLSLHAQDVGGGVRSVNLLVDGAAVDTHNSSCNYTALTPCPSNVDIGFSLDTSTRSDGRHTIQVEVFDAGGNRGVSAVYPILVDNTAPASPLSARAAAADGWADLSWENPSDNGAPVTSAWFVVSDTAPTTNDGANPTTSATSLRLAQTDQEQSVWVWLRDDAGHSDPSSAVRVVIAPVLPPSVDGTGVDPGDPGTDPSGDPGLDPNDPLNDGLEEGSDGSVAQPVKATPTLSRLNRRSVRVCLVWSDDQNHDEATVKLKVRRTRGKRWKKLGTKALKDGCATVKLPRVYRRHGVLRITVPQSKTVVGLTSTYRY